MSEEIAFELLQKLNVLRSQPTRNPAKAVEARAAFLAQAQTMANSLPLSVTNREQPRHNSWMHPIQQLFKFQKKERTPMFGALSTILLIVSLVLGGSGVTVAAAQNSLPDQILYPVKAWSEDVRVQMSSKTQSRLELALEYSQRREEEMLVMLKAGQVPPDEVLVRMQSEIDLALRLAVGQPDGDLLKSLEQIRLRVQAQARQLDQPGLFANVAPNLKSQAAALLDRTRALLQDRLRLCDLGLQNPSVLRDQLRERDGLHDGALSPITRPTNGASTTVSGTPMTTPALRAHTPTPGSSYGPGPGAISGSNNRWTTGTPTPGSGYGPGPGDSSSNGENNPWMAGTPTPGSGYGPGPDNGTGTGSGAAGSARGTDTPGNTNVGACGSGPCDGSGTGGSDAGAGGSGEGGPGGHH